MAVAFFFFAFVSLCTAWTNIPSAHKNSILSNTHRDAFRKSSSLSRRFSTENDDDDYEIPTEGSKEKGLWWKNPPKVSLGSLIAGSLIGVVLTISTLVYVPLDLFLRQEPSIGANGEPTKMASSRDLISEGVTLFEDILVNLDNDYVDTIDPRKLFQTGFKAMLQSLDPYTEFEDLKAAKALQEQVSGKYGGVGLVISPAKNVIGRPTSVPSQPLPPTDSSMPAVKDPLLTQAESTGVSNKMCKMGGESSETFKDIKGVVVVDAFEGYAYNAGIRVGDRIRCINGEDVSNFDINDVRDRLRGSPDTDISITVQRDRSPSELSKENKGSAARSLTVDIRRSLVRISDIKLATLLGTPQDGVGYINLSGFNGGAGKDFRDALLLLRAQAFDTRSSAGKSGDLQGLILDLRGNPGGLLDAAVEIASYLVPEGSNIVSAKSKAGEEIVYRSTIHPITPEGMKLVVLINGNSASASEIVAGAIQDLDAGIIVGPTTTYGKGLVQKIVPLPFDSALKYTIAKYYTPSGRCIQAVKYTGGRETIVASASEGRKSSIDSLSGGENIAGAEVNGGTQIPENERQTFNTKGGRKVRDGGGIEPDVFVPAIKLGPAESVLYAQGLYTEFAEEFVNRNPELRQEISKAAGNEQRERSEKLTSVIRNAFQVSSDDNAVPLASLDSGAAVNSDKPNPHRFVPINTVTSQYFVAHDSASANQLGNKKMSNDRIVGFAGGASNVEDGFFWGDKPTTGKRFNGEVGETLYKEFSEFVLDRVKKQDGTGVKVIDLEGSTPLRKQIDSLEQALDQANLIIGKKESSSVGTDSKEEASRAKVLLKQQVEGLHSLVETVILEDMDRNKQFIQDGIECQVLARELPDRLVVYHTVIQDEQVSTAFDLASGRKPMPSKEQESIE